MLFAGLSQYHAFSQATSTVPIQWQQFRSLGPIASRRGDAAYGVVCGRDARGLEYLCGVEVESFAALPADLRRVRVEVQDYAVFLHNAHISTIGKTWTDILEQWLPQSGLQSAHKPDFEVYDQRFDPRSGDGGAEIWISITNNAAGA